MKKVLKCSLVILSGILTACTVKSNVPTQIDGYPVYEVPFEQPLEINPDKEQVYYFRFKKQPETGQAFTIRAVTIYPWYPWTEESAKNYPIEYKKYQGLIDKLLKEKLLEFEISLSHYDINNKKTKVGLKEHVISYHFDVLEQSPNKKQPIRFKSEEKYFIPKYIESGDSTIINGEDYIMKYASVAGFLMQDKGGYYKLSVRTLKTYPDYPKLKLAIYVNIESTPK